MARAGHDLFPSGPYGPLLYLLFFFLRLRIIVEVVMQNRHPADRLADVRLEIRKLEEEETRL
jgi:hypothetical protein